MKKICKKAMAYVLASMMCFSVVNAPVHAQEYRVKTSTENKHNEKSLKNVKIVKEAIQGNEGETIDSETAKTTGITDGNVWDKVTTKKVFEAENYRVTFTLTSTWDAGYDANIKLENTGNSTIQNWYLGFDFNNQVTNIWNAKIFSNENTKYIIKNLGWNQDIEVGKSVEFGISGNNVFRGFPKQYELLGTSSETTKDDYTIQYNVDSDWGTGFCSSISITNNTDKEIEEWVLEFDFDRNISEIWNGVIEKHNGRHYIIRNAGYNSTIAPRGKVSFGIQGSEGKANDNPVNYVLHSHKLYDGKSMETDTDNDGIPDGIESLLGLNYKVSDSDGDGLDDYFEYCLCDLNPLSKDTDGDGIPDGKEDADEDGLLNELEYINKTNPLIKDSDKDGLNDYEEVAVHFTKPLISDTDGDGLNDYDDVKLGFSPLKADTDNNGILDPNENVKQTFEQEIIDSTRKAVNKVSIEMTTNGNIENTSSVSNMYNIDKLSSEVVGLVGVPVEIRCTSEFEKATITFWYDKNELGDTNENDLAIMWYDAANNRYRLLDGESVINTEKGTVSYVTTHFSTYMLVDKKKWYAAWKENLDYRTNIPDKSKFYQFSFVIDVSGSMEGAPLDTVKEALKGFVEQLSPKDTASLVKFNSYASVVSDFTNDKSKLNNAISALYASGGTDVNSGLLEALKLYDRKEESDNKNDKKKIIVLLCDGDVNNVELAILKCIKKNVSIYAINVGAEHSDKYLRYMSKKTGGEYYYCRTNDSIGKVFGSIQGKTLDNVDPTDTDGDGLYDVYETIGVRLTNGKIIRTNPKSPDTDGDGLSDYQEVGAIYSSELTIGSLLTLKSKYVLMSSDPLMKDTDNDRKIDPEDKKPWIYDMDKKLLIYQSAKKRGLDEFGNEAKDMMYGNSTRADILAINSKFSEELDLVDSKPWGITVLLSSFKRMTTSYFAIGDMESVILDMISHAMAATGSDYSNKTLTKKAYEHKSTQKYINDIKGEVIRRLRKCGGNIYDLEHTELSKKTGKSIYNWVQKNCINPKFKEVEDIFVGLKICVNDTWGNTIEVKDYSFDGKHFSGTLHFCIYDHFGLDKPDVEKDYVKYKGFRAWYILQHYDRIKGSYRPFITLMEFDVPFEGNVAKIRSAEG